MLGNAGKKIQNIVDLAEELYEKVNQLREQIAALNERLDDTHERVTHLETAVEEQRAVLRAVAEEEGIDVDEVLEEYSAEVEAGEADDERTTAGGPTGASDAGESATPE